MPNVPNLVGFTAPAASTALQTANLSLGNMTFGSSATIPPGSVMGVNPAPGTTLPNNGPVDLVICSRAKSPWEENWLPGAFTVLGLAVLIFLGFELNDATFLARLASQDAARGLITFLIVVSASALFIILGVSTIVESDTPDADKRFDRGRQILTMLVGILGTIVGFYYGSAVNSAAVPMKIPDLKVDTTLVAKGDKFTISGTIAGGKAPYIYSISFSPAINAPPITDKKTSGPISEKIDVTSDLKEDVEYTVVVKDADGKSETFKGDKKISPKVAAGNATGPSGGRGGSGPSGPPGAPPK
jgi:uncharacterized membrane protein YfcA